MKHLSYPKIVNAYHTEDVEAIKRMDIKWWGVTEKMHGANVSFQSRRGEEIRIASRQQFCGDGFFNVNKVWDDIEDQVESLFNLVYKMYPQCDGICAYGELIGNGIQKGVFYTKERKWVMFDIFLVHDDSLAMRLPFETLQSLVDGFDKIHIPKTLMEGTLEECLEHPNMFNSGIPSLLGVDGEPEENICEGVVIRPLVGYLVCADNGTFLAIKNKNKKFEEVSRGKKTKEKVEVDIELVERVKDLVNENRFNSARSKLGDFKSHKQIGEFIAHISKDIINDIGEQDRVFTKQLSIEIANFLKDSLSKND